MTLLDYYKSRFGEAVKRQGGAWNGPCPLCGGEPGKSDRFMIWPDRAENLGEVCAQNGLKGIWLCRQCGASGDTIAYLTKVEGMGFKAALAELGIEGRRPSFRRRRAPTEPRRHGWPSGESARRPSGRTGSATSGRRAGAFPGGSGLVRPWGCPRARGMTAGSIPASSSRAAS